MTVWLGSRQCHNFPQVWYNIDGILCHIAPVPWMNIIGFNFTNTVILESTTTFGTPNLWPLFTGGRCSVVGLCYKDSNWDSKVVVAVGRWSLFGSGRSLRYDYEPKYCSIFKAWSCILFLGTASNYSRNLSLKKIFLVTNFIISVSGSIFLPVIDALLRNSTRHWKPDKFVIINKFSKVVQYSLLFHLLLFYWG